MQPRGVARPRLAPVRRRRQGPRVTAASAHAHAERSGPGASTQGFWALAILTPLALIVLLRAVPHVDERWENRPAHFWLVLTTALVCLVLAVSISEGARRRRDARLLLIGLAFVVSAGFLGLHALATPAVAVSGKNAGFVLATPVGLILSGALAALSAIEYKLQTSLWIVRHGRLLLALVLAVIVAWGVLSLAEVGRLSKPVMPSDIDAPLGAIAA